MLTSSIMRFLSLLLLCICACVVCVVLWSSMGFLCVVISVLYVGAVDAVTVIRVLLCVCQESVRMGG